MRAVAGCLFLLLTTNFAMAGVASKTKSERKPADFVSGAVLEKIDDDRVSLSLLESFRTQRSSDGKLTVHLASVYAGGAYDVSRAVISLLDTSESEGDAPNSYTVEISPLKSIKRLRRVTTLGQNKYRVEFDTSVIAGWTDDSQPKINDKRIKLIVELDRERNSVQKVSYE